MAEAAEVPDWHVGTDLQRQAQIQSAEISLLAILAAVQAVERKTEAQAVHLQSLEVRTATAEKRLADCEKTAVEFGNQLEGKWAVLGTLLQEYGLLQRRLENLEHLLRHRNSWALQLPPGSKGEAPKVPATAEVSECFSEQQEGSLEDWQKELHKHVSASREALVCQEADQLTSPDVVPWIKQEEEVYEKSLQGTATIRLCSAETWLASKEKRTPEGEPVGLEPAWAIEARPGKEDFQGGTCGDPLPVSRERVGVSLPRGPPSLPGPAAEGAERGQSSSSRDLGAQQERPPHSPQPFPSAPCPQSAPPQGPFPRRRSAAPAQRSYTCVQCGKSFVHQSTLTTHYRTHTGEKPYACAECEKRFGRLSTLLEHRRTHTGERPFPCVQCGRRFGRLSTLVEHRRTHTGEKPFPCTQCDKRFTRLANLTVHQSVHSGERAFQCSQCGACFAHKPAFLRHLRSHSQEKRFACGQCGKSFTCRSWLVRHQGTHATSAASACGTCEKGSPSHEPPAGRRSCDPSVSPTSKDTGTPQDHAESAGGRQLGGRGQEGPGASLRSGLSVKMENAG